MRSFNRLATAASHPKANNNYNKKKTLKILTKKSAQKSYFFSALVLAALVLATPSAVQAETVAGVTDGTLSVNSSGAANYVLPIDASPGVAGMEPNLSLIYNSLGENGLLGIGWSVGGLSVIYRCPQTLAQDDHPGGVNFDADDRFCLDGQRLIAVSGTYGADGTEYRTEIDTFSRVISYGTAGTGPESFRILKYGVTADSRIEAGEGATVRFWALNRAEDTVGNHMDLSYNEDVLNQTLKIERIDYAVNDVAGTLPQSAVEFFYEARPDQRSHYQAGGRIDMTQRLSGIQTYTNGGLVRDYRFTYDESPVTGRSRLRSVTECNAAGNCLRPIAFDWAQAPAGDQWASTPDYTPPYLFAVVDKTVRPADSGSRLAGLNGDGLVDFLYNYTDRNGVPFVGARLNTGKGWADASSYLPPAIITTYHSRDRGVRLVDLNGDFLPNFIYSRPEGSSAVKAAYLNTGKCG